MISPYAKQGYIDHGVHSFDSLYDADAHAHDIADAHGGAVGIGLHQRLQQAFPALEDGRQVFLARQVARLLLGDALREVEQVAGRRGDRESWRSLGEQRSFLPRGPQGRGYRR